MKKKLKLSSIVYSFLKNDELLHIDSHKNTILRNVTKANEVAKLAEAGFHYFFINEAEFISRNYPSIKSVLENLKNV